MLLSNGHQEHVLESIVGKYADDEVAIAFVRKLRFIRRQGMMVCSVGQVQLLLWHVIHYCMNLFTNMSQSAAMNGNLRVNAACCLAMFIKSTSHRALLGSMQMMRLPSQAFASCVSSAGKALWCAVLAKFNYYYGMSYIIA